MAREFEELRDWSNDEDFPKEISVDLVERAGSYFYKFQADGEMPVEYPTSEYLFSEAKTDYVEKHGIEINYAEEWEAFNFNLSSELESSLDDCIE